MPTKIPSVKTSRTTATSTSITVISPSEKTYLAPVTRYYCRLPPKVTFDVLHHLY